jgi:hypothetical protein
LLNEDDESNQKGVEATRKVTRTLESSDKLSEILVVRKGKVSCKRGRKISMLFLITPLHIVISFADGYQSITAVDGALREI